MKCFTPVVFQVNILRHMEEAITTEREVITADDLERYKTDFNLGGQLDLLLAIHRLCPLTGKTVLEIGGSNIPKPFIFDVLRAHRWVSVDHVFPQNRILWPRQYREADVRPLTADLAPRDLSEYSILDGRIEQLPATFDGSFDAIISIDAFEHVLRFSSMLQRAHSALRSGGQLIAIFSPIWSSHIGHHLWGITDKSGRTFYIESSPIPAWGHLLMRPAALYEYLLDHTDPETADEIVFNVYHSENLSRSFVEDYEEYFRCSPFQNCSLQSSVPDVAPNPEIQSELERLHPGRKNFSRIGFVACCTKE